MRRGLNILAAAGLLLALSGCADIDDPSDNYLISRFASPNPVPGDFFSCYGYGCKYRMRISLTRVEWGEVREQLNPPRADAPAERQQVAEAVGLIERFVSGRTRTTLHQEHSRWNYGDPTQLDCVDNSVNTWTYLTMLERDGLLRYHTVAGLAHRGTLLTLDFSNTAVLVQKDDGAPFAIDPWQADNGAPPVVEPLDYYLRTNWSTP
jgi:hypothetical protein